MKLADNMTFANALSSGIMCEKRTFHCPLKRLWSCSGRIMLLVMMTTTSFCQTLQQEAMLRTV